MQPATRDLLVKYICQPGVVYMSRCMWPLALENQEEWANITTLGSFDDAGVDLAYFLQQDEAIEGFGVAVPDDFQLTGPVNQAVQLYATNSFDYRDYFIIYLREQGKTYGIYDLNTEQNIPLLTYCTPYARFVYKRLISNARIKQS